MNNAINVLGRIKLDCFSKEGRLKWSTGWIKNGVTNAGFAQLALLAGDATAVPFTYLAVGTSSTAFAATQTALQAGNNRHGTWESLCHSFTSNDYGDKRHASTRQNVDSNGVENS
jgi:hypothetical protein